MAKCRPHHWRMPRVGDTALVCAACGRELPLGEIPYGHMAGITGAYARRCGKEAGAAFREAVAAPCRDTETEGMLHLAYAEASRAGEHWTAASLATHLARHYRIRGMTDEADLWLAQGAVCVERVR